MFDEVGMDDGYARDEFYDLNDYVGSLSRHHGYNGTYTAVESTLF